MTGVEAMFNLAGNVIAQLEQQLAAAQAEAAEWREQAEATQRQLQVAENDANTWREQFEATIPHRDTVSEATCAVCGERDSKYHALHSHTFQAAQ